MPAQGTYYLNGTVWAGNGTGNSASNIYTEATLTTAAPAGWYKDNNNVYRQVTGTLGLLGTSASCDTCGVALTLGYGASAFAACCSGTDDTFYVETSFTATTSIYTNPLLTTFAANQFYSYSSNSREKTSNSTTNGLSASTACATCFPSVVLLSGTTADGACCEGTVGTYYMNQPTFTASTILYTDASGDTAAGNGFYSQVSASSIYKQVTGGSGAMPSSASSCNSCPTSISLCYDATSLDNVCCTGCSSLTNFSSTNSTNFNSACSATIIADNLWHNGSGTYPAAGDSIFTNSAGTGNPTGGAISWTDSGTRKIGPLSVGAGGGVTMGSIADCP